MSTRPQVAIADTSLVVEPGRRVATRVRIRNTGRRVAHYRISLVEGCEPAAWATIPNPEVKLNPGSDTDVVLQFEPPNDTRTRAGTFPYGVFVRPGPDDDQLPMVGEADLTVGAITAIDVDLVPKRSGGRFNGKHRVVLDNRGTEDLQVRLRAFDDDEAVSAAVVPQTVNVPAGGTAEALLRVRGRTPSVLGKPRPLPFHVAYRRRAGRGQVAAGPTDGGEVEATLDGTYVQKPIVARWMLVLGALAAAVAAFLVLRELRREEPPETPLSPTALRAEPLGEDGVRLSFVTSGGADTVLARRIDCTTAEAPLPAPLGDPVSVPVDGGPSRTADLEGLPVGERLCFQVRALAGDRPSVWSPPEDITLGADRPPTPTGLAVDPATLVATWDPVPVDDVRYEVFVDGASVVPDGIVGTMRPLTGLAPGRHEVLVQAIGPDGVESGFSEVVTVDVPVPPDGGPATGPGGDDGGDDGGGGGGGGGGGDGQIPPTPPVGVFAVIVPAGEASRPAANFVADVARGAPAGDGPFPRARVVVVGVDIALPPTVAIAPDRPIVVQDGFEDLDEVRELCTRYEALATEVLEGDGAGATSGLPGTCAAFEAGTG